MSITNLRTNYNTISYLRILAWVLILRGHYVSLFTVPEILKRGIILGAGPVVIFFTISGFLTYKSLGSAKVKEYYMRRVYRILPPYYIVLVIALVYNMSIESGFVPLVALRYFTFTNMLFPSHDFAFENNIYGFWTMGCFGVFYAVAPLLMKLIKKIDKSCVMVILSIIIMMISRFTINFVWGNSGYDNVRGLSIIAPFSILYLFVLGMCVAHEQKKGNQKGMLLFLGIFLLSILILEQSGYVLWGCVTALLLLVPSFECKLEENRIWKGVIKYLDRNSFNMYLIHLLIADIWMNYVGCAFKDMIICILLTLVLGELLTRITDKIVKVIRRIK